MATAAETLVNLVSGVGESDLDQYLYLRNLGTYLMAVANNGPDPEGSAESFYTGMWTQEEFAKEIQRALTGSRNLVGAVVASMVVAQLGRAGPLGYRESPKILEGYVPRELRGLLAEVISMFAEIRPRIGGELTSISLGDVEKKRKKMLGGPGPEMLAVLGLNGSGKSTTLGVLEEFGAQLGVETVAVKFPAENGPFAGVIGSALAGERKLGGVALQLTFLADMFECLQYLRSDVPLCIADRLAVFDGQVYSSDISALLSLYSLEGLKVPVTAVVVDRHPLSCLSRVRARRGEPRIFERDVLTMARQQVEFWRLLGLPGVFLSNNDVEPSERTLLWAAYRVLRTTVAAGIWGRALVRMGKADGELEGNQIAVDALHRWFMRERFGEGK